MRKVYFITNRQDGCFYYRCLLPMLYNGWRGSLESLTGEEKSKEVMYQETMKNEVIVFHRPDCENKLEAAKLLKIAGKKIVFDNDDTYRINEGEVKLTEILITKQKVIDEFIKIADLVTTTTEFLAKEYKKLNRNVVILPNCVDPNDWDEPLKNETDKVRIGLVGSVVHNKDFEVIKDVLFELNKDKRIQLVVFGMPAKEIQTDLIKKLYQKELDFWFKLNIDWQPLVGINDYFRALNELRLDIMLIPRYDDYFNRCKSNCKFLEASMLEIPVIAQGFFDGLSPYEVNPEDAKRMIIIKDNNQWLSEIYKLVENKKLREEMGKEAKKYVLKNYDIKLHAHKWDLAYENLKS
jgi:glycosyltransferase involved in cell wall biosynthesis